MKLYEILIGVVLIGLISSGMFMFFSDSANNYNYTITSENNFSSFNKINSLYGVVNQSKNNLMNMSSGSSVTDLLGLFFSQAYSSAKILTKSVDILFLLISDGISKIPGLGGFSNVLETALMLIVSIAIFIGILLHFVIKSDRN